MLNDQYVFTKSLLSVLVSLVVTITSVQGAHATDRLDNPLNLSLEELMQVVVTSASKKAQTLAQTAAAAFVITAEDLRRSGATSIPEALRLAPGVQVAAIGQNKWAVSIRGFNSRFSNKLLVLVDGRAIYSPSFSGVFWEHNDIPLDNIERIEVIRGPGGSLWGANAVNGIINIITYSAKDTQGGLLSVAAGNELKGAGQARAGWALDDKTYLRLHAAGKSVDGGQAVAGGDGPDIWRNAQAGFRLDTTRAGDSISFQGAFSDTKAGDSITAFTAGAPYVQNLNNDGAGQTAHLLGRWASPTTTGSHSLQTYLDQYDVELGVARYRINTFDVEYQNQITGETHDFIWGLGYRVSQDRIDATPYTFVSDTSKTFSLYSFFLQDEIALVPNRWRLTLGSRFEHNDFTGFEVQPNIRLLWTPSKLDSVWAAGSRGVRTPSRGETAATVFIAPPSVATGGLPVATVGTSGMKSEELLAFDLGWRRQWADALSSDLAAFYYRYTDLRSGIPGTTPLFQGTDPYLPVYIANAIGADTYGLEGSLDWLARASWRLQATFSLFEIESRDAEPGASDSEFIGSTPGHLVSLRSSLDITPQWQWDIWLRHVGKLRGGIGATDDVDAYTNMDMRFAWKPNKSVEISLIGQNLLNASHLEHVSTNIFSIPVKIERGVYLKGVWKF